MFLPGVTRLVEQGVSLVGSKPFVPQVDGQAGGGAQLGRKGLDLLRSWADIPGEMQRKADDDAGDAVAAAEASNGAKGFSGAGPGAAVQVEGQDGLGGKAQLVGDGDADAPCADVEGQEAAWRSSIQGRTPVTSLLPGISQ